MAQLDTGFRRCCAAAVIAGLCGLVAPPAVEAGPLPAPTVASGYGWGAGNYGQLGSGSTAQALTPIAIDYPAGTTAVAAGREYTLAITPNGVDAWGRGTEGQLGDGNHRTSLEPVHVALPAGTSVTAVAADDGHNLAVASDGALYAWGRNSSGQLGDGTHIDRSAPIVVPLSGIVAAGTGRSHSLAVTGAGQVYAWGANESGQLGDGTTTPRDTPVLVSMPVGVRIVAVAAGDHHSIALADSGAVYTWGANASGQLGLGTTTSWSTPQLVPGVVADQVVAGSEHSAVLSGGGVLAWGANDHGQLGDGSTTTQLAPVGAGLPLGVVFASLAVSADTTVAVSADATTVAVWGANGSGQVGDGTTTDALSPTVVALPPGEHVTAAAAGHFATVVIVQQGALDRLRIDPSNAPKLTGDTQSYVVHGLDAAGHDLGALTSGVTLSMTGGSCIALVCTPDVPGNQIVTASVGDAPPVTVTATLRVTAAPVPTTTTTTSPATSTTVPTTTAPPDTAPVTSSSTSAPVSPTPTTSDGSGAAPQPSPTTSTPTGPSGGGLPVTGAAIASILALALLVTAGGWVLVLSRRRRPVATTSAATTSAAVPPAASTEAGPTS